MQAGARFRRAVCTRRFDFPDTTAGRSVEEETAIEVNDVRCGSTGDLEVTIQRLLADLLAG